VRTSEEQFARPTGIAVIGTLNRRPITNADLIKTLRYSLQWSVLQAVAKENLLIGLYDEQAIKEPSEANVHLHVERFRRANRLYTVKETEAWLSANHLTDNDLITICARELRLQMLKEALFAEKLEEHFTLNKLGLERIELYRIVVADEAEGLELRAALDEGAEFVALAKTNNEDEHSRRTCGYMGIIRRKELRPEIEAAVCGVKAGTVVGPIKSLAKYHLYLVERFYPAKFDEVCQQYLLDELFSAWFADRFRQADLTWVV
jgi:parvulin-like peptidyl-prolyl isomerase